MSYPSNLKYTKEHEWIKVEGNTALIGVTFYAQKELGDIVFFEIETEGDTVDKDEPFGTIEAVKTVSDLFMPITGEIIEVNQLIKDNPELVNKDPYGDGWMVKINIVDASQLDELLDAEAYKALIG